MRGIFRDLRNQVPLRATFKSPRLYSRANSPPVSLLPQQIESCGAREPCLQTFIIFKSSQKFRASRCGIFCKVEKQSFRARDNIPPRFAGSLRELRQTVPFSSSGSISCGIYAGQFAIFADCRPLCVEIIVAEPIFISIFLQVSLYHIIDIFFHCDII